MKITNGDTSLQAVAARLSQQGIQLDQANRQLTEQIAASLPRYDMVAENVDLSHIWQRARDQGLVQQRDMALQARDLAVRSANDATLTDGQRRIMQSEVTALQDETTRIGLANNINGSHTLARHGEVERVEEIEVVEEVEEKTVDEAKPQIDVLWVVDRSGSMYDKIAHIQRDAAKMFKALEDKGFDARMAIESFEYALDSNGSTDFQSEAADFAADVGKVLGNIYGGIENGLTAIDQAIGRFGGKFDPHATKVTLLLSDEYSDDFYAQEHYYKTGDRAQGAAAEQRRQDVADALKSVDSELYVVGVNDYYGPDKDYTDVIDKVGKGAAINLDYQGKWVDAVTNNFIASVENNVQTKTVERVRIEKVITRETKLLGDWDLNFQVGARKQDHLVETFKTSTADTSGLSGADVSTAGQAREAIDTIDDALGFLSVNGTQVGTLQNRFTAIRDDLANRSAIPQTVQPVPDAFNPYHSGSLWPLLSIHLQRP